MQTHTPSEPQPYQDDEIDLGELFAKLWARKGLIALLTFAAALIGVGIALALPVIYKADALVSPVSSEDGGGLAAMASQFGGLAALAGVNVGSGGKKNEAIATLNSRKLIEDFIRRNDLLPVLYTKQWDAAGKRWTVAEADQPTLWKAVEHFRKDTWSVSQDKKNGLITVAVQWGDPVLAALWVNQLVDAANETLRAQAIANSNRHLAYLNEQLEKTSVVELRQAMFRLIEAEVKNVMLAQGSEQYAFKIIDKAVVPERKIKPKRAQIAVMATVLGLMSACFYVLLRGSRRSAGSGH